MANKRMLKVAVVDTDKFLDMPLGAQALYFHLSLRADDDGFIGNPKKIQNSIKASDDDVKILIAKDFIRVFRTGVFVVSHWNIHNTIKNDRYKKTIYQEEYNMLDLDDNNCYILSSEKKYNKKCLSSKMDTKRFPNIDIDLDLDKEKNYYKKSDSLETNLETEENQKKCSSSVDDEILEEWILNKSKNKTNPSAYAASIKKRYFKKEKSVVDEFEYWKKENEFSKIIKNAIGKTIKTTEGDKNIIAIEPEDDKFNIRFKDGSFAIVPNIIAIKQIINQNHNEEIR